MKPIFYLIILAFLEEYHDNPFLLYLSFYTVHNPLNGKPGKIEKYKKKRDSLNYTDEKRFIRDKLWMKTFGRGNFKERLVQDNPVYASMVESMDENIGKVLDKIKELGIEKNTIIFFMSDNGGLTTSEGSNTTNNEFLNRPLFWHYPHYSNQGGRPGSAIRLRNYKLIEFFEDNTIELYDLENDPGEINDISPDHPEIVKKLMKHLESWRDSVNAFAHLRI